MLNKVRYREYHGDSAVGITIGHVERDIENITGTVPWALPLGMLNKARYREYHGDSAVGITIGHVEQSEI